MTDTEKAAPAQYPKWVKPHGSHMDAQGNLPGYVQVHRDRVTGVTVMVNSLNEEEIALAPKASAAPVVEAE